MLDQDIRKHLEQLHSQAVTLRGRAQGRTLLALPLSVDRRDEQQLRFVCAVQVYRYIMTGSHLYPLPWPSADVIWMEVLELGLRNSPQNQNFHQHNPAVKQYHLYPATALYWSVTIICC